MLKVRARHAKLLSRRMAGALAAFVMALAGLGWLSAAPAFADGATDDLPGTYQLPLRAKASSASAVEPATFTIEGKKFLQGRPLKAGEFTFVLREAGAYRVSGSPSLAKKLQSESLSAAEKYELVAHGGLSYHPNAQQPVSDPSTVTNAADGSVSFGSLTFEGSTLGETATGRHLGTVFRYTVSERPPCDANGQLLEGATKDKLGRYVYQGVTYDDCAKRIYLYAYEKVNADRTSKVVVVPLGDATFNDVPVRTQAGIGAGFRNTFAGAYLDSYDGAVYLEGQPIARGEFKFDVHEVAEDGSLLENQQVSCGAAGGGLRGAEVPVIDDEAFDQPGRFFFAVSQSAPAKSVEDAVQLDQTSYVVTVEVTATDQQGLKAQVTYVRKKPADSTQWVDVNLAAKPSPIIWENELVKEQPDEPAAPDQPADPDQPANPDKPGGAGSSQPGGADSDKPNAPGASDQPESPGASGGAGAPDGSGGSAEGAPGHDTGEGAGDNAHAPEDGATAEKPDSGHAGEEGTDRPQDTQGSDGSQQAGVSSGDKQDEATKVTEGAKHDKALRPFAQTGDALVVGINILIVGVIAAIIALVIARRYRK